MDLDKRYCQNRQRKRKRTIVTSPKENKNISPSEEERQFKLRRFTEDLGRFLSEKENCSDKKVLIKTKPTKKAQKRNNCETVKKEIIPHQTTQKGLFVNGIQTKLHRRGELGVMTREMKTRLDEGLHKIISLSNGNQCQCTHHCCKGKTEVNTNSESAPWQSPEQKRSKVVERLLHRSPPSSADRLSSSTHHSTAEGGSGNRLATTSSGANPGDTLPQPDKELYQKFARVVSFSCSKTKAALFKNDSYVSAVKRRLLDIYVKGIKENQRSSHTSSGDKKSNRSVSTSPAPSPTKTKSTRSVGTSPIPTLTKTRSPPHKVDPNFKFEPSKVHFKNTKKTKGFLEELEELEKPESNGRRMIPSPRLHRYDYRPRMQGRGRQPLQSRPLPEWLLSPPVVGYHRSPSVPSFRQNTSRYVHEPFIPSSPTISPLYNSKLNIFDGSGDIFSQMNSFLLPVQKEDSPDLRYYPKKIF